MNPRTRLPVFLFILLLVTTVVVLVQVQREPVLDRLDPPTVWPGETVALSGRYLGRAGRLTLDGLGVPADAIRSWSPNLVIFAVPEGRSSGNIVVQTETGSSDPLFLTVTTDVPRVEAGAVASATIDVSANEPDAFVAFPGRVLVVRGSGFGPPVGVSSVVFRSGDSERTIAPGDPLLSFWSDAEIRVVVPPGGPWSTVSVEPHGFRSAQARLDWRTFGARYEFGEPERFAVTFAATVVPTTGSARVLFPRPLVSPSQPDVQTLRPSDHEWSLATPVGWSTTVDAPRADDASEETNHLVERSEMVTRRGVRVYSESNDLPGAEILNDSDFALAFEAYLGSTTGISLSERRVNRIIADGGIDEVTQPAARVAAIERAIAASLTPAEDEPFPPSYAFASMAVAVARQTGIPARRVAGMLALDSGVGRRHFWAEAFVPGLGWVPIDPARVAGIHGDTFSSTVEFYSDREPLFALDGNRIAFDTDGPGVPDAFPGVDAVVPAVGYTLRSQRVETGSGAVVDVEWTAPQYLGRY